MDGASCLVPRWGRAPNPSPSNTNFVYRLSRKPSPTSVSHSCPLSRKQRRAQARRSILLRSEEPVENGRTNKQSKQTRKGTARFEESGREKVGWCGVERLDRQKNPLRVVTGTPARRGKKKTHGHVWVQGRGALSLSLSRPPAPQPAGEACERVAAGETEKGGEGSNASFQLPRGDVKEPNKDRAPGSCGVDSLDQ